MLAHVIESHNPFKVLDGAKKHVLETECTVWEWLQIAYPGFVEFSNPTICLFNGKPLLRRYWRTQQVTSGDVVHFLVVHEGIETILIWVAIVLVAAAVVIALTISPPSLADTAAPDPVYDLKGQRNQIRLSSPIEVAYGRCRLWPSYAARPYNKYENNEQWQYSLFCLGQGHFQVHQVYIADTEIENFDDVQYEIYGPGEEVTLFPDNVVTSVEVSAVEMFGPNETEYDSWIGGFTSNPAGTLTNKLEVDVTLPAGLYYANDDGGLADLMATASWEYRLIGDDDVPIGDWTLLFNFTKTLRTNTPQRFTLSSSLASGRYEVRGRRTNDKSLSHRSGNTVRWDALRAFLPSTKDYGDLTLLAVRARASNNLNDNSASAFNVSATRKLRSWNADTQSWNARAATRSIVWAFVDLFQADYAGRLADSYLDLVALAALDEVYVERNEYFDGVFDQKSTIWEAAKTICRVGRAIPMLNGSRVTIIRDSTKTLATSVFNQENIVAGSFKWEIKLANIDDNDGVEIEYLDPTTWKPETVLCTMPDEDGNFPEQLKLIGCTDRDHAYHEGMYIRAQRRYLRENITFRTGLEGHIPSYGDLISISHDLPRWGTGGLVREINTNILTLAEPVEFEDGENHWVVLRKRDGSQAGPYPVTAGVDKFHVVVGVAIGATWTFDGYDELPFFLFGKTDLWGKLCTVTRIAPSDDHEVEIRCVNYNPVIFSFDALTAPPLNNPSLPPIIPALPELTGLQVVPIVDTIQQVLISWDPALGAQSYLVQQSSNGIDWNSIDRVVVTNYTITVTPGYTYIRVSAINLGQGPWSYWEGEVGVANEIPANVLGLQLQTAFNGTFLKVQWLSVATATSYMVRIYQDGGATLMRETEVTDTTLTYSIEDAEEDGTPSRNIRVSVVGVNDIGESDTPAIIDVNNPAPGVLSGISSVLLSETSTEAVHRLSWSASAAVDIAAYSVWGSTSSGFTPGPGNLVFDGMAVVIDVTLPKTLGGHPAYYWRVAALDVWGPEFNASAEQTIAAIASTSGFSSGFSNGFQ